jgi:Predicted acyl-CoA transferases/carnitine dehydratase
MQPMSGMLVVDLSRYLPGAFASRELLELGARVVCIEPPGGDPLRSTAPAWDAALRTGKESLELDLKRDPAPALELLQEADVVLESFRPGVASRLGVGPEHVPERTVYCSITGFGSAAATSSAPGTTSTTSAGQARSWTLRRRCPPSRSQTLRQERSAR